MAASDVDLSLVSMAQALLDGVVDGYGARGITLPERRYWTLGTPANDCEQVVVSWQQVYLGTPGDEASSPLTCDSPRSGVFTVQLCRDMPVVSESGKAPSPEAIQAASRCLLLDAYVLLDILANIDPLGMGVIVTGDVVEVSGGLGCVQVQTVLAV